MTTIERALMPSIMICTPCKDGRVDVNYAQSLMATGQVLTSAGVSYQTSFACTSNIDNGRNALAMVFLKSKCTHLLFIDDDMAWASDLPLRLLNENVFFIGVPYRKKKPQLEYTIKHQKQVSSIEGRPYMMLVEGLGMGMTLINRKVFEKLVGMVPVYYTGSNGGMDQQHLFFRHEIVTDDDGKKKYESEDFHFCRLARRYGFEIWAYVDENLPHIGRMSFEGSYSDHVGVGIEHGFTSKRDRHLVNVIGIEKENKFAEEIEKLGQMTQSVQTIKL